MNNSMVTLGFRCRPDLKLSLTEMAYKENKTLSQFVNELTSDAENIYRGLSKKVLLLESNIKLLESRIASYESQELKVLFNKCKGKKATLKEISGIKKEVVVNTILDLHEVIVKSFKLE